MTKIKLTTYLVYETGELVGSFPAVFKARNVKWRNDKNDIKDLIQIQV